MKTFDFNKTIIWGDSVARGIVYDENRGRYAISKYAAATAFAKESGVEVTNRARMGMTAPEGKEQMLYDLSRGLSADSALIGFGGNDSDFDWKAISADPDAEHLPRTPIDQYEQIMRQMILTLQNKGIHPVLTTLTPVLADRYFDFVTKDGLNGENILKWLGTKNRICTFHDEYSHVVEKLAKEYGCKLVDLYSRFARQEHIEDFYCFDGAHPNDKGQTLIAQTMLQALETA